MITTISKNIRIWREFNPVELSLGYNPKNLSCIKRNLAQMGFNKSKIKIKNQWFDVISPCELVRKRSSKDRYFRAVYIQIDMDSGEYYIGKVNRPKWSEIKRYQGSGLKFLNKFKKNKNNFSRYFIASCETAEETERIEASIVTKDLLQDTYCLNLVTGGAGTNVHPTSEETKDKIRKHMKESPDQYQAMLLASKEKFQSGDTYELRSRSNKIKETMSSDKYREMTRKRILKWRKENPEEYERSREKNRLKIKDKEVQKKRKASLEKWKEENPEKYKEWQEKRVKACGSKRAKEKQSDSIKEWAKNNPIEARKNAKKRAKAAGAVRSKSVSMIDLETGEVLKEFPSGQAAARYLVEIGKAKNTNCASSINSVCNRRPCTTGYGYRKKAYGFDWRFTADLKG